MKANEVTNVALSILQDLRPHSFTKTIRRSPRIASLHGGIQPEPLKIDMGSFLRQCRLDTGWGLTQVAHDLLMHTKQQSSSLCEQSLGSQIISNSLRVAQQNDVLESHYWKILRATN